MSEWSTPTLTPLPFSEEGEALARQGWRLLSYDPETGKEAWMMDDGATMKVRTIMPVDDLLEQNATARAENEGKRWGDGQVVMRMPIHMHQRILGEAQAQGDERYIRKILNDPDFAKFRVRGGRV